MSKYHHSLSHIYLENTDIPKNKLNISDSAQLHAVEEYLLTKAYEIFTTELSDNSMFDESYFKSLHRRTFSGLYDWAGEYRIITIHKGDSTFCLGQFVEEQSKRIFSELENENYLRNIEDKKIFIEKLTYFKCEIIALHPFYELNGRTTRLFFDLLCAFNGYKFIDYSLTTSEEYIQASIETVCSADNSRMKSIITKGLK